MKVPYPSRNGFSLLTILLGIRYENYGGRCIRRRQESLQRSGPGSDDLCEAERILHPWHVVEENNNGTIVDIKTKNIYHQDEYKVIDVDGEEVLVVCDGDEEEAEGEIIYFDSVQLVLSNVLTSVSLVCLFLHILIHSSLKKLRHKEN